MMPRVSLLPLAFLFSCTSGDGSSTTPTGATGTPTATTATTASTGTDTGSTTVPAATGDWTWVNPLPQGSPVEDVEFATDTVAYALSDGGGLLRTDDAGASWGVVYPLQDLGWSLYYGMSFVDAQEGWLVGYQGRIAHTDDGGATWQDQSPAKFDFHLNDVAFTSADHGVAVGNTGKILTTDDGGATWTERSHGAGGTFFHAVAFASDTLGWVGGDDGTVLETTDGGATWALVPTPFDDDIRRGSPAGTGVAFATRTEVQVWDGSAWTREVAADGVLDLQFDALGDGVVLLEMGGALRLGALSGGTLSTQKLVLDPAARSVARRAGRLVFGGWWGAMYASSDDGTTVDEVGSRLSPGYDAQLLDVSFAGDRGVAVGFDGLVMVSDDRGVTWTSGKSGLTTDLRSVWLQPDGTAVTVGYDRPPKGGFSPRIQVSSDHGLTWSAAGVPTVDAYLTGVALWDDGRGLAVGGAPGGGEMILLTENGGKTWSVITRAKPTPGFVDVWTNGTDRAWLGAGFGDVVLTENGGSTFTTIDSGTSRAFEDIHFVSATHGWAATGTQDVLATTDGGHTWSTVARAQYSFDDLHFASETRGIAVAGSGAVFGTDDGGKTWERQAAGWSSSSHVRAVAMLSETDAVIVGTEAKIQYTRTAGGLAEPKAR